jgi:hypothetical protein
MTKTAKYTIIYIDSAVCDMFIGLSPSAVSSGLNGSDK